MDRRHNVLPKSDRTTEGQRFQIGSRLDDGSCHWVSCLFLVHSNGERPPWRFLDVGRRNLLFDPGMDRCVPVRTLDLYADYWLASTGNHTRCRLGKSDVPAELQPFSAGIISHCGDHSGLDCLFLASAEFRRWLRSFVDVDRGSGLSWAWMDRCVSSRRRNLLQRSGSNAGSNDGTTDVCFCCCRRG